MADIPLPATFGLRSTFELSTPVLATFVILGLESGAELTAVVVDQPLGDIDGLRSGIQLNKPAAALKGVPTGLKAVAALAKPTATANSAAAPTGIESGIELNTPTATPNLGATATGIESGILLSTPAAQATEDAGAVTGIKSALVFNTPTAVAVAIPNTNGAPTGIESGIELSNPPAVPNSTATATAIKADPELNTPAAAVEVSDITYLRPVVTASARQPSITVTSRKP